MDDRFLYNHIKQAIRERKKIQKNTQSSNFAENYCRRQLMKKKINFDATSHQSNAIKKMKSLMKNFQHLDTYIDLNELLYSINTIKAKQQLEYKQKQFQERHRMSRISRLNHLSPETRQVLSRFHKQNVANTQIDPIQTLKDKFKGEINDMIKKKYQTQNTEVDLLVEHLQSSTCLYNSLLKNHSTNYLSYLNHSLQKIQKQQDIIGQNTQENLKIFKYLTENLSKAQENKYQKQKPYFKSTNLNSKQQQQENELLHKISTFLQIALENQHKQKWATKEIKKFRSTHGSFRFKKDKQERGKFFIQDLSMGKQNKSFFELQKNKKDKNFPKKSTLFLHKVNSQKRNLFTLNNKQKDVVTSFNQVQSIKSNKFFNFNSQNQQPSNIVKHKSLFRFSKTANEKERNTVPVNEANLVSYFEDQFNVQEKKILKRSFVQEKKRSFLLNKPNKSRQYGFISPDRQNAHFKTVIVKGNENMIQNQSSHKNKSIFHRIETQNLKQRFENGNLSENQSKPFVNSFLRESKSNTSFHRKKVDKKTMICQNFTFKKRGKKQQILKKLNSFIEVVNIQEKVSKQENQYYDSAINKLHDISRSTYKNYEPQALASAEEISQLKKFVNSVNPSLRKNHSKNSGGKRNN